MNILQTFAFTLIMYTHLSVLQSNFFSTHNMHTSLFLLRFTFNNRLWITVLEIVTIIYIYSPNAIDSGNNASIKLWDKFSMGALC